MKSRFTSLFLVSTLACAGCAALVAMLMVQSPPIVHMSKEMALQQLSVTGLGLFVMLMIIIALMLLMRLRRRIKYIHHMLLAFTKGDTRARLIETGGSDDLCVLERRINQLAEVVDLYVREERALLPSLADEDREDYVRALKAMPLSLLLDERAAVSALANANEKQAMHASEYQMKVAGTLESLAAIGEAHRDGSLVDDREEISYSAFEELLEEEPVEGIASSANDGRLDLEAELDFDSLKKDSLNEDENASDEDELETVEDDLMDDSAAAILASEEYHDAPVSSYQDQQKQVRKTMGTLHILTSHVKNALTRFYQSLERYEESIEQQSEAQKKEQDAVHQKLTQLEASLFKARLLLVAPDAMEGAEDHFAFKDSSGASDAEATLKKGIDQVAVMARQVKMYAVGAAAQAEKDGGGEGFKSAAQEIKTLAEESAEAAKKMQEALSGLSRDHSPPDESALRQELLALLPEEKQAEVLSDHFDHQQVEGKAAGGVPPLQQAAEMMEVLQAALDKMQEEVASYLEEGGAKAA